MKVIIPDYYAIRTRTLSVVKRSFEGLANVVSNHEADLARQIYSHSKLKIAFEKLYTACLALTLPNEDKFKIELPFELVRQENNQPVESQAFEYRLKPAFHDFFSNSELVDRYRVFLMAYYQFAVKLDCIAGNITSNKSNIVSHILHVGNLIQAHLGQDPLFLGESHFTLRKINPRGAPVSVLPNLFKEKSGINPSVQQPSVDIQTRATHTPVLGKR